MKFLDEYRDSRIAQALAKEIAERTTRSWVRWENRRRYRNGERKESRLGHHAYHLGTTCIVDMLSGDQLPRIC